MKTTVNQFRTKLAPVSLDEPPYVDYNSRCRFAMETMMSVKASPNAQIVELKRMLAVATGA